MTHHLQHTVTSSGDGGNWTGWESTVEQVAHFAKKNTPAVVWDVWNEPDHPWSVYSLTVSLVSESAHQKK